MITYVTSKGEFVWTIINKMVIYALKLVHVDLYAEGALDKEIYHDVQMMVSNIYDYNGTFFIYQRTGNNNGKYPSKIFRFFREFLTILIVVRVFKGVQ